MGIRRMKRRAGVALAATALLTGVTGFAAAGPAQASASATCWGTDLVNNSNMVTKLNGTYHLKNGIGAVCGNIRSVSSGSTFYIWCGAYNPDSGVLWFLGRVKGDSVSNIGYMSSDNLNYVSGTWSLC